MVNIRQIIIERENLCYSHIPLGVFQNSGVWPKPRHNYSLFLYTNDDSDRVIEWILYHKTLGFSHFYIYSFHENPELFYEKLIPFLSTDPLILTYHHYPNPGTMKQAFCHYFRNYGHESKWSMVLNIDEFLCLKQYQTINDFISSKARDYDAWYFNVCVYGHNYFDLDAKGDILLNYTLRSSAVSSKTRVLIKNQSLPYKELFQSNLGRFQTDFIHLNPNLETSNVLNDTMNLYFANYPHSAIAYLQDQKHFEQITDIAYIAHFGIPSVDFITNQANQDYFQFYAGDSLAIEMSEKNLSEYGEMTNAIEDLHLQNKWIEILIDVWEKSIFPVNFWSLLSEHKNAEQSSTEHLNLPQEDANNLINGKLTGHAQNMTQREDNPWWCIDLENVYLLHEIQIFNRLDLIDKTLTCFELHISEDKKTWKCIFKKNDASLFGGIEGSPFIWTAEAGFEGRYVKIIIPGQNKQIALDQIRIYGQEI